MWLERCSGDGEREAHWKRLTLSVASWQNHGTATWPLGGHIVSDGPHVFHKGFHMLFNQPIDLSLILWNICTEIYLYLTGLSAHIESINSTTLSKWPKIGHIVYQEQLIILPSLIRRKQMICEPAHITKEEKDLRRRVGLPIVSTQLCPLVAQLLCLRHTCPQMHTAAPNSTIGYN